MVRVTGKNRSKERGKGRESQKGEKDKIKENKEKSTKNTLERRACSNPFMRLVGRVRTGFTLDPVNPVLNKGRGEQMNPPRDPLWRLFRACMVYLETCPK